MANLNDRELFQLITAAFYYYEIAENEKKNVDNNMLNSKIGDFQFRNRDDITSSEQKSFFIFSTHIASSAIRLNSIEDHLKNAGVQTNNRKEYQDIENENDHKKRLELIDISMKNAIHFYLRHMVSHSENEIDTNKRKKNNKTNAYNDMRNKYYELTYGMLYEFLNKSLKNLEEILLKYNIEKANLN